MEVNRIFLVGQMGKRSCRPAVFLEIPFIFLQTGAKEMARYRMKALPRPGGKEDERTSIGGKQLFLLRYGLIPHREADQ
jgi:hypothetical protein